MTILGISSSPVRNGNVDRMVEALLRLSRKEAEFVNLNDLDYGPCMACPHLCAPDNICKLDDGLRPYYEKIIDAEAVVLGSPSYFGGARAPCFVCGDGLTCRVGSFWTTQGEVGQERLRAGRGLFQRWEDSSKLSREIEVLGMKLAAL